MPPPKTPIAAPRQEPQVDRFVRLPDRHESLVTPARSETPSSRQQRRQARRGDAKASRPTTAIAADISPALAGSAETPLPPSRALVTRPTGIIARIEAWFSRLVPQRRAAPPAVTQEALAEQMLALRQELAMVQGRLDRMIGAVTRK